MKYTFKTMKLSTGRELVRIHFDGDDYYGLERFFNDDATVLYAEIQYLLEYTFYKDPISLAGNRTTIIFDKSEVMVEDQWEEGKHGFFRPVTVNVDEFEHIFRQWEIETR